MIGLLWASLLMLIVLLLLPGLMSGLTLRLLQRRLQSVPITVPRPLASGIAVMTR
jgi:hypothetical protein